MTDQTETNDTLAATGILDKVKTYGPHAIAVVASIVFLDTFWLQFPECTGNADDLWQAK